MYFLEMMHTRRGNQSHVRERISISGDDKVSSSAKLYTEKIRRERLWLHRIGAILNIYLVIRIPDALTMIK